MTLAPEEFMRRFLLHVLPSGFHRIRHYGLIANTTRKDNLARARELLMSEKTDKPTDAETKGADTADSGNRDTSATYVCPDCGAPMIHSTTARLSVTENGNSVLKAVIQRLKWSDR